MRKVTMSQPGFGQSPQVEATKPAEEVRRIAMLQKGLLLCVLALVILYFVGSYEIVARGSGPMPDAEPGGIVPLLALLVGVIAFVFALMLALKIHGPVGAILLTVGNIGRGRVSIFGDDRRGHLWGNHRGHREHRAEKECKANHAWDFRPGALSSLNLWVSVVASDGSGRAQALRLFAFRCTTGRKAPYRYHPKTKL